MKSAVTTPEEEELILFAERALTPSGELGPLWLHLVGGRIITTGTELSGPDAPPRAPDLWLREGVLAPGLIDLHCHGGGGASFEDGLVPARAAVRAHRLQGTTTMLASLVSAPVSAQLARTAQLAPLTSSGELAGVHLEGPWISDDHRGAHGPEMLSLPQAHAVRELLEHPAARWVRSVTLAPELPGALEAIAELTRAGVVVGRGHTGASYERTREALEAGASVGIHLFNGMRGIGHREPGPVPALLEDPSVLLELIADGVHLHPAMLRLTWNAAAAGPQTGASAGLPPLGAAGRILLVSDAMAAAGAPDGDYELGPLRVLVQEGTARVVEPDGAAGAIAGSTLTLSAAVQFSITQASIAPELALQAATANPARLAGFTDRGALAPGQRADLVVFDAGWSVRSVMHSGQWTQAAGMDSAGVWLDRE